MKDVTVVASELQHLVVLLVILEADRAHIVQVQCQVGVRHRLHLIDNVQAALPSFSIAAQLSENQEENVADETPVNNATDQQEYRQHSYEVAFALPVH